MASINSMAHKARQWPANLSFVLECRRGKTVLSHLAFDGPLRIQKPFYPEESPGRVNPCHLYLLHPPGGLVSGDHLSIDCTVESMAHGLVTTPSAAKIYRATIGMELQSQETVIKVRDNGVLEWLPQETIVFDGARASLMTRIELESKACLIGWDIVCYGRPAISEGFKLGQLSQRLTIAQGGRLLLTEHLKVDGDSLNSLPILNSHPVIATFFVGRSEASEDLAQIGREIRDAFAGDEGFFGFTVRKGLLLGRFVGSGTEVARDFCLKAWRLVRPRLLEREICPPRIWNT